MEKKNDCLIPDDEFSHRVKRAIENIDLCDIADTLQVHPSTIRRWASGTAKPHPSLRWEILEVLEGNQED